MVFVNDSKICFSILSSHNLCGLKIVGRLSKRPYIWHPLHGNILSRNVTNLKRYSSNL